jgi:hypothetical protein
MSLFRNKRAITPLVATILLVAFSVGLGALVMSWGEEYIEEKAEFVQGTAEVKSGCDAAKIDIIKISGQAQICTDAQGIQFWLDNGPDIDLYNIHARVAGQNGVDVREEILSEPLLKSNAVKSVIPYDRSIGQILQLKLTPKIWTGRDVAICSQSSINVERIPAC